MIKFTKTTFFQIALVLINGTLVVIDWIIFVNWGRQAGALNTDQLALSSGVTFLVPLLLSVLLFRTGSGWSKIMGIGLLTICLGSLAFILFLTLPYSMNWGID